MRLKIRQDSEATSTGELFHVKLRLRRLDRYLPLTGHLKEIGRGQVVVAHRPPP